MKNILNKIWTDIKDIFSGLFNSMSLFKLRKKSFLAGFIVVVATILLASLPPFFQLKNQDGETIMNQLPSFNKAFNKIFTEEEYRLDCEIVDHQFKCHDDFYLHKTIEIPVTINEAIVTTTYLLTTDPTFVPPVVQSGSNFSGPQIGENFIHFGQFDFVARYVARDPISKKINEQYIVGNYSSDALNNRNFGEIFDIIADTDDLEDKALRVRLTSSFFMEEFAKGLSKDDFINFISMFTVSILLFNFLAAMILKGFNLFNKGVGFKFKESFKISTFALLQPLILAYLLSSIFKFIDFTVVFAFSYFIRIVYLYLKYVTSKNSNLFELIEKGEI